MVATASTHNIMALLRLNKRDRTTMTPPFHETHDGPAGDQEEEEYERAVAFLRAFHARTARTTARDSSLDAIREADGSTDSADEALARDFAHALSVSGRRRRRRPLSSLHCASRNDGGGDREPRRREPCAGPPRMRKTVASACLRDLAGAASDDGGGRRRPPLSPARADDGCYSLGRGCDDGGGLPPVAKRRRFLFLGDGAPPSLPWSDGAPPFGSAA